MKWLQTAATRRLHVKIRPVKLAGLGGIEAAEEDGKGKLVAIEVIWKGPNPGLLPFYRSSANRQRNQTNQRVVGKEGEIEWDDEFERICGFPIISRDPFLFGSWDVSLNILFGENVETKAKLDVLGKIPVDLSEMASKLECSEIERKFPITLKVDGTTMEATLDVLISFAEVRSADDSPELAQTAAEQRKEDGFFRMVKGLTAPKKKKKEMKKVNIGSAESNEPVSSDSDGFPENESSSTAVSEISREDMSSGAELDSNPSASVLKSGLFSWKRRRLNFGSSWRKTEPTVKKSDEPGYVDEPNPNWEMKELLSRDGEAKLKGEVFLASFDQRSEKAAGESACTALVAVIADWLHSNPGSLPTRPEFDTLITEGSREWRKLCENAVFTKHFPDKHFDLETVLEADLRPVKVLPGKSFTGFFSPEKFESLEGLMSFDGIWDEISNKSTCEIENNIYIVSWNDHFFVLKVEHDAYYIIDSLGERLFEGCNQAYILKFDASSSITRNEGREDVNPEATSKEKEEEEIICKGKECCKEYIKRFLAAIPVGELEMEERKGSVSTFSLHQRLQIDFHYSSSSSSCCCSSSSSSSSPSRTSSPSFLF